MKDATTRPVTQKEIKEADEAVARFVLEEAQRGGAQIPMAEWDDIILNKKTKGVDDIGRNSRTKRKNI